MSGVAKMKHSLDTLPTEIRQKIVKAFVFEKLRCDGVGYVGFDAAETLVQVSLPLFEDVLTLMKIEFAGAPNNVMVPKLAEDKLFAEAGILDSPCKGVGIGEENVPCEYHTQYEPDLEYHIELNGWIDQLETHNKLRLEKKYSHEVMILSMFLDAAKKEMAMAIDRAQNLQHEAAFFRNEIDHLREENIALDFEVQYRTEEMNHWHDEYYAEHGSAIYHEEEENRLRQELEDKKGLVFFGNKFVSLFSAARTGGIMAKMWYHVACVVLRLPGYTVGDMVKKVDSLTFGFLGLAGRLVVGATLGVARMLARFVPMGIVGRLFRTLA